MISRLLLWPSSLILLSGCERADTVRHYTAPKPPEAVAQGSSAKPDPHAGMMAAFAAPEITDASPPGWVLESSPPRLENLLRAYHVPGGQLSGKGLLLAFPPGSGSLATFSDYLTMTLAIKPLTADEAAQRISKTSLGGKEFEVVALSGGAPTAQRTAFGACWNTPGAVYFALLSWPGGEEDSVRQQFHQWLGSFEVKTPSATGPTSTPSAPVASAGTSGPVPAPEGLKSWKVPAEWTAGPAKSMRAATLLLPGIPDTSFAVIVSAFPGDLGGALPNANRWLRELGSPPLATEEAAVALAKPLGLNSLEGSRYSLDGAAKSSRILWVKTGGKSWFFKMIGEPAVIKREESRFEEFARSLSF